MSKNHNAAIKQEYLYKSGNGCSCERCKIYNDKNANVNANRYERHTENQKLKEYWVQKR